MNSINADFLPKKLGESWITMARLQSHANATTILPKAVNKALQGRSSTCPPAITCPYTDHVSGRQCGRGQPMISFNSKQHQMHSTQPCQHIIKQCQ